MQSLKRRRRCHHLPCKRAIILRSRLEKSTRLKPDLAALIPQIRLFPQPRNDHARVSAGPSSRPKRICEKAL
jgi:hypothetical protein